MIKTKTWILIFALVLTVCLIAAVFLYSNTPDSLVVQVLQDGNCIQEIDLAAVKTPYRFTVEDPYGGSNTILVEPGRICVENADCPDQICVLRGWLTDRVAPIVCIPHRLVIQMAGTSDVDAVAS